MKLLSALLVGILFGFGLALSGMAEPQNVLAFLTVSKDWNPSLMIVMATALATSSIGYRWVLKRDQPLYDTAFHLPTRRDLDARLLTGSSLFGLGWGMSGYCPGPALVGAFVLDSRAVVFLLSFLAAMAAYEIFMKIRVAEPLAITAGDG